MNCPNHPEATASKTCSTCHHAFCARCITYAIDGRDACDACGQQHGERSRVLGGTLIVLVAAGYLATFAGGYLIFHARPFVGALAAVTAVVLSRTLQMNVHLPAVIRATPHNE